MNENVGYIVNLSARFNAGNYLYYFFPSVASEKVLHFKALAEHQLPTSVENQEREIKQRIWKLKNHWHLYRLNPKHNASEIKINIILDYGKWQFLKKEDDSRIPFAKLTYIKHLFEQHFSAKELKRMCFQYFFIYKKDSDIENSIQEIDTNNGFLKNNSDVVSWFSETDFEEFTNKTYPQLQNQVKDNIITDAVKTNLIADIDKLITTLQQKVSIDTVFYTSFKEHLLNELKTNEQLTDKVHKKRICTNFIRTHFSSESFLRKGKDILFRIKIDDNTVRSKINSYEQLSALLVETITVYQQNDPVSFWSSKADNQSFNFKKITFDQNQTNELFSLYKTLSENVNDEGNIKEIDKKQVKQSKFNDQLNPETFYKIDQKELNNFISVNNLTKDISFFYSKEKYKKVREKLHQNSFTPIEQIIKKQSFEVSKKIDLEGDYGLSDSKYELSYKEITVTLNELKQQEREAKLISTVNEDTFKKEKETYQKEIIKLQERFLHKLRLLPKLQELIKFSALFLVLSLLFTFPLYSFAYPKEALFFMLLIAFTMFVVATVSAIYLKNKVLKEFKIIKHKNIGLANSFNTYVKGLATLAKNVRESTLRRRNINELEKIRKEFDDAEKKQGLYKTFYEDLVEQLEKNGYDKLQSKKINKRPEYNCSPYYDYRVRGYKNVFSLTIKQSNSEKKYTQEDGLKSTLNNIRTIEFE